MFSYRIPIWHVTEIRVIGKEVWNHESVWGKFMREEVNPTYNKMWSQLNKKLGVKINV